MTKENNMPPSVNGFSQFSDLCVTKKKTLIRGVEVDGSRLGDQKYFVKKAYQVLCSADRPSDSSSDQEHSGLVRELERRLKTEFNSTRDLNEKVEKYLAGYDLRKAEPSARLRRARKKLKLTQGELARRLGYTSHVPIANFERGKRPLTRRVSEWLESIGM
jgi:DNA-binding transcriptional regulator YiaG